MCDSPTIHWWERFALDPDALASDPTLPAKAAKAMLEHGLILRALGQALAVSPPLTITSEEIQFAYGAAREGLDALVHSYAPAG